MLLTHYYALAGAAALLTAAWLFRPRDRTQVTTLTAFFAWSLTALLGGDTEVFDASNETITTAPNGTELAVETAGEFVAAPVPAEVRYFAALWALLSGLALILYVWGVYPPTNGDEEAHTNE
jgi:hypothetical protein